MHGESVGPFHVESTLGSGGMGTVYLTRLVNPAFGFEAGDRLALKIIHAHLLESGDYYERFLREARVGVRVRHENVVEVYGADEAVVAGRTVHYIVMEHVAGRTLREILADLGTVPESLLREIGRQVAEGLAAIHAEGIVHRDLKPENVILTDSDHIRIMDLGMARLIEGSVDLTIEGHFAGSLQYAAPEQFNELPIGPRADLYSLGSAAFSVGTRS